VEPKINVNPVGLFAAWAAAMIFGFLWFGPILGRRWAHLMGKKFPGDKKTPTKARSTTPTRGRSRQSVTEEPKETKSSSDDDIKHKMLRGLVLEAVAVFLKVFVLAHATNIWRPSVWGLAGDKPDYVYGFMSGIFNWIGLFVPMQLGKVAWEDRPWELFLINTSFDFLSLQLMCHILSHFH